MRHVPARALLIVGGLAFVAYAYPGLLTLDSVDQLAEARAGFYTDAHPPAMAVLWGVLDAILAGPFLMLVVQGAAFLAGSYLVLARALAPRAAAIAASLVLLYPPVLTPMAFIWKDSLMAALLVLGAGLVFSERRGVRLAALGCFALATAVKYNAFVATLPLVVLGFEWRRGERPLRRYGIAAAAWLGVTGAAMSANTALVDQPMYFWHSSLAVADIAGVIHHEDSLTDDELRARLASTGLLVDTDLRRRFDAIYEAGDMMKLVVGEHRLWDLPISGKVPAPQAQRDAIGRAWWQLVTTYPGAYLRHRLETFLDVIGVTYRTYSAVPPRIMFHKGFLAQQGLSTTTAGYQDAWTRAHRWLWRNTPLFRQWVYVAIALVLALAFCRGHRDIAALLCSGLTAEGSLLVLGPSPDYRYSHWTIVCTCLAVVMLVSRRARGAPGAGGTRAASPPGGHEPPDRG